MTENSSLTGDRTDAGAGPPCLEQGILQALVYADLFDYPLTLPEIHRYVVGCGAALEAVQGALHGSGPLRARLGTVAPFWFLVGRDDIVHVRRAREAYAQLLWPAAWQYGRQIAALPFIRLVAVSGALAMNNVSDPHDDIDLLLVAYPGRVWLARALTLLIVHLARRAAVILCPNYVLAEDRLPLAACESNLFTAHELAQVHPLYGLRTYRRLLACNSWVREYLPNTEPCAEAGREIDGLAAVGQRIAEWGLGGRVGETLERWERTRKIARLSCEAQQRGGRESLFGPDLCKGHMDNHGVLIGRRFVERLKAQGI